MKAGLTAETIGTATLAAVFESAAPLPASRSTPSASTNVAA